MAFRRFGPPGALGTHGRPAQQARTQARNRREQDGGLMPNICRSPQAPRTLNTWPPLGPKGELTQARPSILSLVVSGLGRVRRGRQDVPARS